MEFNKVTIYKGMADVEDWEGSVEHRGTGNYGNA